MLKKLFTAAALALSLSLLPQTGTSLAAETLESYPPLRGLSVISKLDTPDMLEIRQTAPQLKETGDWNRRVAYYLGAKSYAVSTMWAPLQVQLVTPYSLIRYLTYQAGEELQAPDQTLIDEVTAYKNVVWIWVWSNGSYNIISNNQPPTVENVVIRTGDNSFYYHLDKEKYMPQNALAAAKVPAAQLWPFPAKLFSQSRVPFDIVIADSHNNKKPLTIGKDDLAKCK